MKKMDKPISNSIKIGISMLYVLSYTEMSLLASPRTYESFNLGVENTVAKNIFFCQKINKALNRGRAYFAKIFFLICGELTTQLKGNYRESDKSDCGINKFKNTCGCNFGSYVRIHSSKIV